MRLSVLAFALAGCVATGYTPGPGGADLAQPPSAPGPSSPPSAHPDMAMAPSTTPTPDLAGMTATEASGTISADATWSGLYHVGADLTVAAGATLTVSPGTVVAVAPNANLFLDGKLAVAGTSAAPVLFTTAQSGATWSGVVVRAGGQADLAWVTVEYGQHALHCAAGATLCRADHATLQHFSSSGVLAEASLTLTHATVQLGGADGLSCDTATAMLTVTDSVFHQTGGDAVWVENGSMDFERNAVYGNVVGGSTPDQHCAIHLAGSGTFTVKANDFSKSVYGFMASAMGDASTVSGNNFFDNGTQWGASQATASGAPMGVSPAVNLAGNYWGGSVPAVMGNSTLDPNNPATYSASKIPNTGPMN